MTKRRNDDWASFSPEVVSNIILPRGLKHVLPPNSYFTDNYAPEITNEKKKKKKKKRERELSRKKRGKLKL